MFRGGMSGSRDNCTVLVLCKSSLQWFSLFACLERWTIKSSEITCLYIIEIYMASFLCAFLGAIVLLSVTENAANRSDNQLVCTNDCPTMILSVSQQFKVNTLRALAITCIRSTYKGLCVFAVTFWLSQTTFFLDSIGFHSTPRASIVNWIFHFRLGKECCFLFSPQGLWQRIQTDPCMLPSCWCILAKMKSHTSCPLRLRDFFVINYAILSIYAVGDSLWSTVPTDLWIWPHGHDTAPGVDL